MSLQCLDLEQTHFDSHHVYRIEWQPGPYGYIDWYALALAFE